MIAHRGSSGTSPENTMAAFRQAVAMGADMIELDVRLTKDGLLAVIHDRHLRRTTSGRGAVRRKTGEELQHLDAGRWFAPRFAGERIPLLDEVLRALPVSVGINIEVKTDGDRRWRKLYATTLAHELRRHGRNRVVLVTSFNHRFIRQFRSAAPSVAAGVLAMPVRDAGVLPSACARRLGVSAYVCGRSRLRLYQVQDAHQYGIRVYVYGVNTARQLVRPRRFGVDGVITDHPDRMLRLLARVPVNHHQSHPT